jgi:hypothetical protein
METKQLSPIKRMALAMLDKLKEQVVSDCDDDDEISESLTKFHPSSNKEYFNPNDYCNADKAMKILHLGYNRNKFFELTKEYGIENHKVNNAPLGYKVSEIERLNTLLIAQNKVVKQKKKKGQTKYL